MKALVTGGGGFLGRAIVQRLLGRGHEVTVAARGSYPDLAAAGVRLCSTDLVDLEAVKRAVEGHEVVFHAAAKTGVWGARQEFQDTNVRGTENVLRACSGLGVRRIVYTSSPSVVFDGTDHEDAGNGLRYPRSYESHYPESKAVAERMVLSTNGRTFATVALRPHLIWGPGDPHLLPRVFSQARKKRLRVVGDGRNKVSITYIDNAAEAHVQAGERLQAGASWAGQPYFVNDAEPVELWPWLQRLLDGVGLPPVRGRVSLSTARTVGGLAEKLWLKLGLGGEPPLTRFVATQLATSHWYSLTPARLAFGYEPVVGPDDALARTIAWWRERLGTAAI